jgi:pimeloyl-ACP methyl ester carboxylesterase
VVNLLDFERLDDAVLVGHSYAGVVVTAVADRRPERLNAVVYLDTSPLPSGMSIADVQLPDQRDRQRRDVEQRVDGWRWPDGDTLTSGTFGSTAGLNERHLRLLEERATAQPYATFTAPLELARNRPPGVRRAAILCTDGGIDLALLRTLLAEGDPRAAVFGGSRLGAARARHRTLADVLTPGPLAELLHDVASMPPSKPGAWHRRPRHGWTARRVSRSFHADPARLACPTGALDRLGAGQRRRSGAPRGRFRSRPRRPGTRRPSRR